MKVGVYFDLRNPPQWRQSPPRLYGFTLEACQEAERLGASSAWFSEHHLFEDDYLCAPLTFAAAVAARTQRIRLGTAIVIAPLHHPAEIAEQSAVVDLVSDGRLDLGLCAGRDCCRRTRRCGARTRTDLPKRAIPVRPPRWPAAFRRGQPTIPSATGRWCQNTLRISLIRTVATWSKAPIARRPSPSTWSGWSTPTEPARWGPSPTELRKTWPETSERAPQAPRSTPSSCGHRSAG